MSVGAIQRIAVRGYTDRKHVCMSFVCMYCPAAFSGVHCVYEKKYK